MVPAQYHNFRDVFSKEAFDKLPPQKAWDHAIDLSPGTELPHSQMFPLSPAEQKELDDFLWENLVNGHICPSKSPMGAPVFFIKKKRSEEHTSELQSPDHLVCRLLLEKKKQKSQVLCPDDHQIPGLLQNGDIGSGELGTPSVRHRRPNTPI